MIFGLDLFATVPFADSAQEIPEPPPPPEIGVWVEQCPTVNAFNNQTIQASTWAAQNKQGSTWNNQEKNITTTEKCDQ